MSKQHVLEFIYFNWEKMFWEGAEMQYNAPDVCGDVDLRFCKEFHNLHNQAGGSFAHV